MKVKDCVCIYICAYICMYEGVVEALLQAHKHAAAVADQVQVGAARDGMHSDLCIRMGHMHMHVHVVFICANICMCVCAFVWSANFFFVPDAGSTALFCACLRVCEFC